MTEVAEIQTRSRAAAVKVMLSARRRVITDYFSAISGSAGRLVFSLAYFVALANTLTVAEFGLFATASAAGVVLSRILAFGFAAPVYRIATVKPRIIGTYVGGFLALALVSLPVIALAGYLTHLAFFAGEMVLGLFAIVVFAETVLWRMTEVIVIINNGMGRFGRAAVLVILGTVFRATAALTLLFIHQPDLQIWAGLYALANAASLLVAWLWFMPKMRLRFEPRVYRLKISAWQRTLI